MRGLKTNLILIVFTLCFISTVSAQWVRYTTSVTVTLQASYFLNEQTGWAVGNSGAITKTTNGGSDWITQTGVSTGTLYRVHFVDENTGVVCGNEIYATTDGGTTWDTVFSNGVTFGLKFINSNTGLTCGAGGKISKTTNAGLNWIAIGNSATPNLTSIDFADENTGWTCGTSGVILKTTNGGNNWTSLSSGTTNTLNEISFSNLLVGIVVGNGGVVLKTTTGGANWYSRSLTPSFNYRGAFFMPNTTNVWITMQNVGVFCSPDGGDVSWQQQTYSLRPSKISFTSDVMGYGITDSGRVIITKSGGFNLSAPNIYLFKPYSSTQMYMEWDEDLTTVEDKFIIERSSDSLNWAVTDSVVADYGGVFGGLNPITKYYYRVYRKKGTFRGPYSDVHSAYTFMPGAPALSFPINNVSVYSTLPVLSWTAVPSATSYRVEVSELPGFNPGALVYSATVTGLSDTVLSSAALHNTYRYYWRVKALNGIYETANSSTGTFKIREQNFGSNQQSGSDLYYFANSSPAAYLAPSRPVYNWRDTTGSTNLIVNQTGTPSYGNLDNGSFVLNNVFGGNKTKFFGNDFTSVNISTNGYVTFLLGDLSGWPVEPTDAGLPAPGMVHFIAPLWADLYYEAPFFPSRLCYKVTDDELIITYSKVIMYNLAHVSNVNMCVSFQVIIHHESAPTMNSKIEVMYNYDETGPLFKNNYNEDFLRQHLIGIQGSNSSNVQTLTYRFQNSANVYSYKGPIFGSNLGLAFSPEANLLPVELSSFTSQINGSSVKLNWSTVNEQNNSGFEIERTNVNENNWKKINFVQGNGTTNESKNYSYEDRNVTSGKYQYRLKQIDFNGNYEYHQLSNEVEIGVPKKFNLSQNYPNPFNPATKINYELPITNYVSIKIYDLTGKEIMQLVNQNQNAGYYTVEFNASNLASGMYFYQIQAGDFSAVKKMVLVK